MKRFVWLLPLLFVLLSSLTACQKKVNTTPSAPEQGTLTFTATTTGTRTVTQTFTQTATPTVTCTPTIKIVDHFTVYAAGGGSIGNQVAGVPFDLSITAWTDAGETTISQAFSGNVQIRSNFDYSDSDYVLTPREIAFTQGFALQSVRIYRSAASQAISVSYGVVTSYSSAFDVIYNTPAQTLIIVQGMTHMPGLEHLGLPGYDGYSGSPCYDMSTHCYMQLGSTFNLSVVLTDQYYNRVTATAQYYAQMTSTDATATINGVLCTDGVYVTVTAGVFESNNAVFYVNTVPGGTGMQKFTADIPGFSADTSPAIMVHE